MRSILGLALLVAASLGGIEYATKLMPMTAATSAQPMQATLLASSFALAPQTFGGVVQTVAATQAAPLPPVTVAPQAPHAEPINPIVEPIKRPPPKAPVTASKPALAKATAPKVTAKSKVAKATVAKSSTPKSKVAKTKEATPKEPTVIVTRPGFKLTCTVAQKLDPAKQRCVPLKR